MKIFVFTSILFTIVTNLPAQDCWLQPDKFIYDRGEPINIRFHTGGNFEGENWGGDISNVNSLRFYYGGIDDDLTSAMGIENGDSVQLSLFDEGTAMVTFNSNNSFIQQDSAVFNDFLEQEGQQEVIAYRKKYNQTDSSGRESYQQSAKTIFQVGKEFSNTFKEPTALPVDIILQQNPYAFTDSQTLTVKIFFQNEPLNNTLVKIWHREKDKTTKIEMFSNENGEINFMTETSGEWMVSCVKMVAPKKDRKNGALSMEWQRYRGSCTWGYD